MRNARDERVVEICSREDAWCVEEFEDVEAESSCNDGGFGDAGLVGLFPREDFSLLERTNVNESDKTTQEFDDLACRQ